MKVLYAGDSPPGGSADYLLGILYRLRASVRHVLPQQPLSLRLARECYDAIILSDYPRRALPAAADRILVQQVDRGAGLLMVGGWASFAAGGWQHSLLATRLPVVCRTADDRVHLPGGAAVCASNRHPMFRGFSFRDAPVICGLNTVRPRRASRVVLTARKIIRTGRTMRLDDDAYPLFVIGTDSSRRVAALTTDLAPHWCGGLVDWGSRRVRLAVTPRIRIEVGDRYVRFVSSLLRWLVDGV